MRLILFLSRASSRLAKMPMINMIIKMMTRYSIISVFPKAFRPLGKKNQGKDL